MIRVSVEHISQLQSEHDQVYCHYKNLNVKYVIRSKLMIININAMQTMKMQANVRNLFSVALGQTTIHCNSFSSATVFLLLH